MTISHRILLSALGTILFTAPLFGQDEDEKGGRSERHREIKAQQSAYLTKRMSLSPEEAQRFWPIHNRFDEEMDAQRRSSREAMRSLKDGTRSLTEAEATRLLEQRLTLQELELTLRKRYDAEFRKAIGAVKTLELYRAERDFHREMLKHMRDKGPGGERGRDHMGGER